ncbi:MotA/TolQ/ExbB proton channel family protein [Sulfurovum mangrovi]|uniref:MotA/TolQ/ExbB proton channel family protein n=1 Tax=Sulfurovum mangrovi TaxID=2893889 RepID=UPI001E411552|nr:MotA/TolQ/ExbB proton channel family protein [Sulfurovum mangrovi]UFH58821.1 MotA/TolQ/ExbB proton channel family protein [Sulfurovum mangrovi]
MLDIMHYVDRGGIIVYILIGLNIIGFTIMLWKFIVLIFARWQKEKIIQEILLFIREHDLPIKEKAMQNAIDHQINALELGLNTIKTIASIAPLLGLLGTVVGVLGAFDAVSQQGLGDPAVFSSGISVALVTTVAGLIVAIPHYIGYNYFISLLANIEIGLEKEVLEQL